MSAAGLNQHLDVDGVEPQKAPIEAQSTFASTLLTDVEKQHPSQISPGAKRAKNLFGTSIDPSINGSGLDPVYAAKVQLLNEAMLDVGMGRYQWTLLIATAVGWFLDNFWITSFTVILPAASNEAQFFYTSQNSKDLMISLFAGLTLGSFAWPVMSDHLGRKQMFTSTVVLMGMAGLVGAGMTAFTGLCVVGFVVGLAVGGNQAVDAILLLECLPASHQWLVPMQGALWGLGELVAYAVGWAFVELYTCGTGPDEESTASSFARRAHSSSSSASSSASSCHYVSNKGWRYTWWTFGCITLFLYLVRFSFRMYETPKSLLARRRDAEAVQTVRDMANANKQITWLSESSFARVDTMTITEEAEEDIVNGASGNDGLVSTMRSFTGTLGPLGLGVLVLLWATLGLTFPLHKQFMPLYLAAAKNVVAVTPQSVTTPYLFRRYLYVAVCAIPGPLVAGCLIEVKSLGRKRTGALLSLVAGLLMLVSAVSSSRQAVLGFECLLSFLQYALLAVVITYTVEVFGAPARGAALGTTTFFWRLFGLVAWIVAAYSTDASGAAAWFSGALMIATTVAWILLPRETRGMAAP